MKKWKDTWYVHIQIIDYYIIAKPFSHLVLSLDLRNFQKGPDLRLRSGS